MAYNEANGIIPTSINKTKEQVYAQGSVLDVKGYDPSNPYALQAEQELVAQVAEEQVTYQTIPQMEKALSKVKKEMEEAAKNLDFMEAARLRDEMFRMQKDLEEMKK